MIKYGLSSLEKQTAKELWLHCFSDSLEYTNYYFENIFSISKFLFFIDENNKILSGLNENSYIHNFNGTLKPISFIVGAGTFKEYRNLGIFSQLLSQSLKNSFSRDENEIFLIPAVPDLYKKFGFQFTHFLEKYNFQSIELNNISLETIDCHDFQVIPLEFSLTKLNNLNSFYENFQYFEKSFNFYKESISKFNSTLLETKETFFKFLHELYFETGTFYTVISKNQVVGVFSLNISKNIIDINNFFFQNKNSFFKTFSFIDSFSKLNPQYEEINITVPLHSNLEFLLKESFIYNKTISPFIMMRITNVKLSLYDFFNNFIKTNHTDSFEIVIQVKDNFLFQNTGYFHIIYNLENSSLNINKITLDYLKEQQLKIDFSSSIETLTLLLYGVEDFTTVLKEEKINLISPHNLVFFQNSFIKKINYIHKYV